jgi:hypothetical protein
MSRSGALAYGRFASRGAPRIRQCRGRTATTFRAIADALDPAFENTHTRTNEPCFFHPAMAHRDCCDLFDPTTVGRSLAIASSPPAACPAHLTVLVAGTTRALVVPCAQIGLHVHASLPEVLARRTDPFITICCRCAQLRWLRCGIAECSVRRGRPQPVRPARVAVVSGGLDNDARRYTSRRARRSAATPRRIIFEVSTG